MTAALLIPLTALFSALHGWGRIPKATIVTAHVLTCTATAAWAGLPPLYALASGVVLPLFFWCLLRRGKQANKEMAAMQLPADWLLDDVAKSHLPHLLATLALLITGGLLGAWVPALIGGIASVAVFFLPVLVLCKYNYIDRPNLVNTGKFWDVRRPCELATGLSAGVQHAVLLWTLTALVGA